MKYKKVTHLWEKFPLFEHTTPPVLELFGRGDMGILDSPKKVGIVGPRKPTIYGIKAAQLFGRYLAKNGVCVVSGLAMGIDAYAHYAALDAGGKTIGVTACDLDRVYPTSNKKLYDSMYKHGLVVSEYSDPTPPRNYLFPKRNRIVAAMCDAIILVEATFKSGALITGNLANEMGVRVLAVPGSIFSMNSMGTNRFIEQGADPLYSTEQLDLILGINRFVNYSKESMAIYEFMKKQKIVTLEDLSHRTEIDLTICMKVLQELRAEGLVSMISNDRFALIA